MRTWSDGKDLPWGNENYKKGRSGTEEKKREMVTVEASYGSLPRDNLVVVPVLPSRVKFVLRSVTGQQATPKDWGLLLDHAAQKCMMLVLGGKIGRAESCGKS